MISGRGDERYAAIQRLVNQKGMLESNEYWVMYREGEFGWRIMGAKVVTNSVAGGWVGGGGGDSVNRTIAGRCWIKNVDNKWMRDAVAEGVRQEKEMTILGLDVNDAFAQEDITFTQEESEARTYWDNLSGKDLDPKLIKEARAEDMRELKKHTAYEKVPLEECWGNAGQDPIGTRWVDVNKGDNVNPEYRSRLVAQDIRREEREDLFAATPPLEANKVLMSMAVTEAIG